MLPIHLRFESLREVAIAHKLSPTWTNLDEHKAKQHFIQQLCEHLVEPSIPDVPGCLTWQDYSRFTEMMNRVKRDLDDKGLLSPKERIILKEAIVDYFKEMDRLQIGLAKMIEKNKQSDNENKLRRKK